MNGKRITIYHIAEQLGMSASYVSRALNNHPSVSESIKERVKKKAAELNYKLNSQAANLRQGSSKTIGVIVPHIDQSFFSDAIAGIEEACFENNHSLIICQSHESFKQEMTAIETLIRQNVDCILISLSAETKTSNHLEEVKAHNIHLIQFDRCLESFDSFQVVNDNEEASYKVVTSMIEQGYRRIAFIGGPSYLQVFHQRKEGYLKAIKEAGLSIPYNFVVENALSKEKAAEVSSELLNLSEPPDALFTVSDHQSLGVLEVANAKGIIIPCDLGLFGFANEAFTNMIKPALSSVDQHSKELGRKAANLYFEQILKNHSTIIEKVIIESEVLARESSMRLASNTTNRPPVCSE
jgi:DNA-binding LacI/PurR family transcriptional regulator